MNAQSIRELLNRRPFEPFEIHMTNGEVHPVKHSEMAILVGARMVIGYPETDRIAILSLLHVATIHMPQMA